MSVTLTSDLSQQVNWTVREKTDCSLTLNCLVSGVAHDTSAFTFVAEFYKVGATSPFLSINPTNGGVTGVITIPVTDTQLTITPEQYWWKLKTTAPTDNLWFQGIWKVNGYLWDGASSSSASVSLTIGDTTIDVELTLITDVLAATQAAVNTGTETATFVNPATLAAKALSTGTYSTELTFDTDKDIYQDLTGLSPTFTLAASGNINGKGIFLRLNKPTAVTFPGTFEAASGSTALDATKLNVYLLIFFTNWNGSGLDHVVYRNETFTAI